MFLYFVETGPELCLKFNNLMSVKAVGWLVFGAPAYTFSP